jgi:hypothetical protein
MGALAAPWAASGRRVRSITRIAPSIPDKTPALADDVPVVDEADPLCPVHRRTVAPQPDQPEPVRGGWATIEHPGVRQHPGPDAYGEEDCYPKDGTLAVNVLVFVVS